MVVPTIVRIIIWWGVCFFFLSEMPLPMIPFHLRAISAPSRQLTWAHWVVSPCLWPLLLNTSYSRWSASLGTSLCKWLSSPVDNLNHFTYNKWYVIHRINSWKSCCSVNIAVCLSPQHRGAESFAGCAHFVAPPPGEQHRKCGWDQQHLTGAHPRTIGVRCLPSPHLRASGDRVLQHHCQSRRPHQVSNVWHDM